MATYAVTAQASFSSKARRDTARNVVESEAATRGWSAVGHYGFGAGAVAVGNTTLTASYTVPATEAEIAAGETAVYGYLTANAVDGAWFSTTLLAG